MAKIQDKQFLKYIKEMHLDFKHSIGFGNANSELRKVIKQILKTKSLNVLGAKTLYKYVEYQLDKTVLERSFEMSVLMGNINSHFDLVKEWTFIKNWIEKHFSELITPKRTMKLDIKKGSIDIGFDNKSLIVELYTYNPTYYQSCEQLFNSYHLVISAYIQHQQMRNKKTTLLDFFRYSVKNIDLNDSLQEDIDFTVEDNKINITIDNEEVSFINMGEFNIDQYEIFASGSYMFIIDSWSGKKYLYYGD